jgi:hypothetical protein
VIGGNITQSQLKDVSNMNALRLRISTGLLEAAATQALECRDMWRRCDRSDVRTADNVDLQVLALLEAVSRAGIRLGVILMPRRLADPAVVRA